MSQQQEAEAGKTEEDSNAAANSLMSDVGTEEECPALVSSSSDEEGESGESGEHEAKRVKRGERDGKRVKNDEPEAEGVKNVEPEAEAVKNVEAEGVKKDEPETEGVKEDEAEAKGVKKDEPEAEGVKKAEAEGVKKDEPEAEGVKNDELEAESVKNDELEAEGVKNDELETESVKKDEPEAEGVKKDEAEGVNNDEPEAEGVKKDEHEAEGVKKDEPEAEHVKTSECEAKRVESGEPEAKQVKTGEHEAKAEREAECVKTGEHGAKLVKTGGPDDGATGAPSEAQTEAVLAAWWKRWEEGGAPMKAELERIKLQGIGPFMLGLGSQFPDRWINALIEAKALDSRDSSTNMHVLSYKDVIMVEIFTYVFDQYKSIFYAMAELLKEVLDLVDAVEEKCVESGRLNVKSALSLASKYPFFDKENGRLELFLQAPRYSEFLNTMTINPTNVQMTHLFFCKHIHSHVHYYGKHKTLLTDKIINSLTNDGSMDPAQTTNTGKELFKKGDFFQAIQKYSTAMKLDYTSCFLYDNRAQCYLKREQYWEALSDCRRAITVNPDWYKGYYRAAEACLKLDDPWKEARAFIKRARLTLVNSRNSDEDLVTMVKDMERKIDEMNRDKAQKVRMETSGQEVKDFMLGASEAPKPPKVLINRQAREITKQEVKDFMLGASEAPKPPEVLISRQAREITKRHIVVDLEAYGLKRPAPTLSEPEPQEAEHKQYCHQDGKGKNKEGEQTRQSNQGAALSLERTGQVAAPSLSRTEVDKFKVNLREGLEAFNLHNMLRAVGKYQAALTLWSHSSDVKAFMDSRGVTVVRYAFGIAAVSEDSSQNDFKSMVLEALHTFQLMQREEVHHTFPLLLYGLARTLIALYRYAEALEVLDTYTSEVMQKDWKTVCWPLSEQVIKESQWDVFQAEMEALRELCSSPPKPDAVCWEHVDTEEGRPIYLASPTYAGMVSMHCRDRCFFKFHVVCWKSYKTKLTVDKISDKEMVDRLCPTPDCGSFICYISVHKPHRKMVEITSDRRPVRVKRVSVKGSRMKPCQRTLDLRREKKEATRQRKAAARQADSLQDALQSWPDSAVNTQHHHMGQEEASQRASTLPSAHPMVVLTKEKEREEDGLRYNTFQKTVKQKKRKEKKEKAMVKVELNFADNPDRERVGTYDLGEDEEQEGGSSRLTSDVMSSDPKSTPAAVPEVKVKEPLLPAPLPPPALRPLESFSQVVASFPSLNPLVCKTDEDTRNTLTRLLHDILAAQGPQRMERLLGLEVVRDIGEDASRVLQQCGGMRSYFQNSQQFVVIGDWVGVSQHAPAVQQLAQGRGSPSPPCTSSAVNPYPPNAHWSNTNQPPSVEGGAGTKNAWGDGDSITTAAGTGSVEYFSEDREMTLPTMRKGLNPTAPEFQPLKGSRMNDIDEIELGSYCRPARGRGSLAPAEEDSDTEDGPRSLDMHDIDEVDLDRSSSEAVCPTLDQGVTLPATTQGGMSQRSSQSDLSQAGSDLSTGMLFRTNSPSSSISSHRNARDVGSPFSARDANSPASLGRGGSESTARQSGSPDVAGEATGAGLYPATDSVYLPPTGLLPPAPKPLKPLNPIGGSAAVARLGGAAGGNAGRNAAINPPPGMDHNAPVEGPVFDRSTDGGVVSSASYGSVSASAALSSSSLTSSPSSSSSSSSMLTVAASPFTPGGEKTSGSVSSVSPSSASSVLTVDAAPFTPTTGEAREDGGLMRSFATTTTAAASPTFTAPPPGLQGPRLEGAPLFLSQAPTYTPSSFPVPGVTPSSSTYASFGGSLLSPSSAKAEEFKPSLTQSFASSNSLLRAGGFSFSSPSSSYPSSSSSSSSALPLFSPSNPWSVNATTQSSGPAGGGGGNHDDENDGVWAFGKNNSFPSAIRPDEPTVNPALSTFNPSPFPPYASAPWSAVEGEGVRERKKVVDAEVQVRVEGRSVEVSTDLTGHDLITMQETREAFSNLQQMHIQLSYQLDHMQQERSRLLEKNQVVQREAEERQATINNVAMQRIAVVETESAQLRAEHVARETQLLTDLQTLQEKNQLSNMETNSLLQRATALEKRALQAEVRVIQEQMENFKLTLGSKLREVERQWHEFRMSVSSWQRSNAGQAVPQNQVTEVEIYFQHISEAIKRTLDSVMNQLSEKKGQILVGKILAELEPVSNATPQLPKPPDALKHTSLGQAYFCPSLAETASTTATTVTAANSVDHHLTRAHPYSSSSSTPSVPSTDAVFQAPLPLRPPMPMLRPLSSTPAATLPASSLSVGRGLGVSSLVGASALVGPQLSTAAEVPLARGGPAPPAPLRPLGAVGRGTARPPPLAPSKLGQLSEGSAPPGPPLSSHPAPVKLSSFERLVSCLQRSFPTCDREAFQQCVQEMRKARSGSLSGLDLDYIVRHVTQMLIARGIRPSRVNPMVNGSTSNSNANSNSNSNNSSNGWGEMGGTKRTAPPPGISATWSVEGLEPMASDLFVEEEDPCAICTDELSSAAIQQLDCGHRFHDHCIRTWFKQQTTCPKCRSHAPLQEDFPLLK